MSEILSMIPALQADKLVISHLPECLFMSLNQWHSMVFSIVFIPIMRSSASRVWGFADGERERTREMTNPPDP